MAKPSPQHVAEYLPVPDEAEVMQERFDYLQEHHRKCDGKYCQECNLWLTLRHLLVDGRFWHR